MHKCHIPTNPIEKKVREFLDRHLQNGDNQMVQNKAVLDLFFIFFFIFILGLVLSSCFGLHFRFDEIDSKTNMDLKSLGYDVTIRFWYVFDNLLTFQYTESHNTISVWIFLILNLQYDMRYDIKLLVYHTDSSLMMSKEVINMFCIF